MLEKWNGTSAVNKVKLTSTDNGFDKLMSMAQQKQTL